MRKIFYLFLAYLLAPKIDLIPINLSSIRLEDFICVGAVALFVINGGASKIKSIPQYLKLYVAFVLVCFMVSTLYIASLGLSGFIFSSRILEYVFWAFAGLAIAKDISRKELTRGLTIVSMILILWGVLEFLHAVPKIGRFSGVSERLSINTTGPFEISVLLVGLAFCIESTLVRVALVPLVFLTQARSTLIAAALAYFVRSPGRGAIVLIMGGTLLLATPALIAALGQTRIGATPGPVEMAQSIGRLWVAAPTITTRQDLDWILHGKSRFDDFLSANADMSFEIRVLRTAIIQKWFVNNPAFILVGIGPGAMGVGVDNNYLRAFVETGTVGLTIFLLFIVSMYRQFSSNSATKAILITMAFTAIFIDIFWSSKAMPFLWMISSWEFVNGPLNAKIVQSALHRKARNLGHTSIGFRPADGSNIQRCDRR